MAKKMILVMVFLVLAGTVLVFSDIDKLGFIYMDNMSEAAFRDYNPREFGYDGYPNAYGNINRTAPVGKLPKEVITAIWEALSDYDYAIGDVFIFTYGIGEDFHLYCVLLRLSVDGGKWTFNYRARRSA
jgi:hypothetical protein